MVLLLAVVLFIHLDFDGAQLVFLKKNTFPFYQTIPTDCIRRKCVYTPLIVKSKKCISDCGMNCPFKSLLIAVQTGYRFVLSDISH